MTSRRGGPRSAEGDAEGRRERPNEDWPFPPLLSPEQWRKARTVFGWTPRELEVVACLCRGVDYADACRRLGIRMSTLKTQAQSAYRKIGCGNRVGLILTIVHWHGASR